MLARQDLAARAFDFARLARDCISPSRRRALRERATDVDALSSQVSPHGLVLAGPFQGLRFPFQRSWGGLASRVAGTYECEIAPYIEEVLALAPNTVVDAGAADGYYAVGMAQRLPSSRIFAFVIDPFARKTTREVARMNGVNNVEVRGRVTPRELRLRISASTFVLCDVEGYEAELLDPNAVPALRNALILVELHEFVHRGVTRLITSWYQSSHDIEIIDTHPRLDHPPQLSHLDLETARLAMDEGRPAPMQWAFMRPRLPPSYDRR